MPHYVHIHLKIQLEAYVHSKQQNNLVCSIILATITKGNTLYFYLFPLVKPVIPVLTTSKISKSCNNPINASNLS